MDEHIVMKVTQRRNVFSASQTKVRNAVASSVARHDPVVKAGLDYIGGPGHVRDMSEAPRDPFGRSLADDPNLRGIYIKQAGKVYLNTEKYGDDLERVAAHELSHAAAERFRMDMENEEVSPSVNKKLDQIDFNSMPLYAGEGEEARNRLMDQKRGIWPGTQNLTDQTIEDFKFVRDHTEKGFDTPDPKTREMIDTGERFRAARKREEDLLLLNEATEEHFAPKTLADRAK